MPFQSTLPARGATAGGGVFRRALVISIHAPRTGSDCLKTQRRNWRKNFNPRSPHGERRKVTPVIDMVQNFNPRSPHGERQTRLDGHDRAIQFQSTLPARGATTPPRPRCRCCCHFNPRSPHGERQSITVTIAVEIHISTHAPRTGSDRPPCPPTTAIAHFNPRSPHGERLAMMYANGATQAISIHAPRTESDCIRRTKYRKRGISIHAPRTGSDLRIPPTRFPRAHFNPRSPHGERLPCACLRCKRHPISIHAPRTGSDGAPS